MIESGSNCVPLIWSTAYFMKTLWRTFASSQQFGGSGERGDDDRLVPLDAAGGVRVLVREPDGVAELVPRRAAVEEAEVHRRLVGRDVLQSVPT